MRKLFITAFVLFIGASAMAQDQAAAPAADGAFCDNLKKLVTSAQTYFSDVKGEGTTIEIRGVPKAYFKSTLELEAGKTVYLGDNDYYPEATTYLVEGKMYSESLLEAYNKLKKAAQDCLGSEWVSMEKDKTNDIFLEDTEFKKFILKENKKGKKVSIEIYMYNQRELNRWVVEFKMTGVGK
jgi:hypothetical protein